TARPLAPSVRISLDQDAITRGQSTTLRWNSNNADRVAISDLGTVQGSGSRVVSPSQSTTYTATATGPGGSETASARLTVTEEPPSDSRPRTTPTATSPAIATLFGQQVQAIFFDYDSAEIKPDSQDRLRRAAS